MSGYPSVADFHPAAKSDINVALRCATSCEIKFTQHRAARRGKFQGAEKLWFKGRLHAPEFLDNLAYFGVHSAQTAAVSLLFDLGA